ncbi:MAG TPA: ABC transporter permease [Conexibacter sp.]|jgi:putative ABC transport system permease protein|nr:ABC transporter permease [Conexibacter sp.]
MRTRNLLFLYVQRIRAHPLQELLALVGIAVGVALVFAVQVANTSVAGSVEELVKGITGRAQLQVTARDTRGFPSAVAAEIARVPGVRTTAPIVDVRVGLRGRTGTATASLVGGDRSLVKLGGRLLGAFASPHLRLSRAVALPRPLASSIGAELGGDIALSVGARTHRVPVATLLTADEIGGLVGSPVVLAPLHYAQQISAMRGRVTRVLVVAEPGRTTEVRAALERIAGSRLNVSDSDAEARLLRHASAPNDQSTALFAAISALVGMLFAFNAMLLTVPERRRFIADLRLEGLGDLTVVRLVLFDALVLGVAASGLGLLLGDLLSRDAFHAVPGYLTFAFAVGDQRVIEPQSVALAVAGGLAATLLAAMRPLIDLVSSRPLDAVYGEDEEREEPTLARPGRLALGGVVLVAGALLVLLLVPALTASGIVLLLAGMLLLIPAILAFALRLLDVLSHRSRSSVLVVAVGELGATTTRSLALAAIGALAVFGSVAMEGAHADLQRGLDMGAHGLSGKADLWVVAGGDSNVLSTTSFRPAVTDSELAAVRGVRAVSAYRGAFLDVGDRRAWVVAPPRSDPTPLLPIHFMQGDLTAANVRLRSHGWVALSQSVARDLGVGIGDVVTLPTPLPRRLRLAAILTNMGWSSGAIVLNAADFRRAWGTDAVTALGVMLEPGASPAAVAGRLRHALGPSADLAIESPAQREQRFRVKSRQGLGRLTQIATLMLVAAALALALAMSGVVWSRRPRLMTLKLSGFTDGEVWRTIVLESAIVLGAGCSIGALFGLLGQFMLTSWLSASTGFPTSYAPAGWLALTTFAGVTVVAVAVAALPGFAAARVSPTPVAPEP